MVLNHFKNVNYPKTSYLPEKRSPSDRRVQTLQEPFRRHALPRCNDIMHQHAHTTQRLYGAEKYCLVGQQVCVKKALADTGISHFSVSKPTAERWNRRPDFAGRFKCVRHTRVHRIVHDRSYTPNARTGRPIPVARITLLTRFDPWPRRSVLYYIHAPRQTARVTG